MPTRKIIVNPDDPNAGDHAFGFYDKSNPVDGKSYVINPLRKQLKGLRGKRVTMTVVGFVKDPDTLKERPFRVRRTRVIHFYKDLFGRGSLFLSCIKAVLELHSDEEIVVLSISLSYPD